MIIYGRGTPTLDVIFRVHGSALYKAFIPSMCSTGILLVMHYLLESPDPELDPWFSHPYPIAAMLGAFTFLLTFKGTFSYNRYWEACTAVHQMQSKWLDVGMEISAFHLQSKQYDSIRPPPLGRETKETNVLTRERMSAISPSELQEAIQNREVTDENLGDIGGSRRNFMNSPSGVMKSFRVSKNRQLITNEASGVFQAQESIPNDVKIIPSFFLQEATHLLSLLSAVAFSTLRSDIEGVETPLTTFLEGNPWPPVDPDCMDTKSLDLKHGEGTDAMMGLFSFLLGKGRSPAQRTIYNASRPFSVVGGVSDAEVQALQKARGPLAKVALCTIWLQEFVAREFAHGSMGTVAPPIISRLFQFTSDGMVGYNQARKVAYNPFPFPHDQLTAFYIVIVIVCMPVLSISYVSNIIVACVLNSLTVAVFDGLWEVAKELQDPFKNAPNDLPLNNYQAQFNEALLMMYSGYHPESAWLKDQVSKHQLSSEDEVKRVLDSDLVKEDS